MDLFLTSSPCDNDVPAGVSLPCIFFTRNGFVDALRGCFRPGSAGVILAASPHEHDLNDEMAHTFAGCFAYHGMPFSRTVLIDGRNPHEAAEAIRGAGVVILGGGHVPTQNAFLHEMGVAPLLQGFEGIVMGISAGSMNCAATVYAQPEWRGEATDPRYRRFLPGLGLTDINVLPHLQETRRLLLDGLRLFEDITFADSHDRAFLALPDGSYVHNRTLHGEAWRIAEGRMERLTGEGDVLTL